MILINEKFKNMSELKLTVRKLSSRLEKIEEIVLSDLSDYQPAIKICKKYEISRSLRDNLVKKGLIKEYRLLGKIYFKESEIIGAFNTNGKKEAA